jgi:REP element-mobilizing transposase RayT
MPDHLHALVEGTAEDSDFRRFVSMFKQRSGYSWRRENQSLLWQEGYYEHVLRSDEAYLPIVAYILRNPVRAGLTESPSTYLYLGSDRYSFEQLADAVAVDPRCRL